MSKIEKFFILKKYIFQILLHMLIIHQIYYLNNDQISTKIYMLSIDKNLNEIFCSLMRLVI